MILLHIKYEKLVKISNNQIKYVERESICAAPRLFIVLFCPIHLPIGCKLRKLTATTNIYYWQVDSTVEYITKIFYKPFFSFAFYFSSLVSRSFLSSNVEKPLESQNNIVESENSVHKIKFFFFYIHVHIKKAKCVETICERERV